MGEKLLFILFCRLDKIHSVLIAHRVTPFRDGSFKGVLFPSGQVHTSFVWNAEIPVRDTNPLIALEWEDFSLWSDIQRPSLPVSTGVRWSLNFFHEWSRFLTSDWWATHEVLNALWKAGVEEVELPWSKSLESDRDSFSALARDWALMPSSTDLPLSTFSSPFLEVVEMRKMQWGQKEDRKWLVEF